MTVVTREQGAVSRGRLGVVKAAVPWWAKVATKIVLSRLPVGYRFWKAIGIFEHGAMDQAAYAVKVFRSHFAAAPPPPGFVGLELGPGDSVASALVARAYGASLVHLIDVGAFALREPAIYRAVVDELRRQGLPLDVPLNDFDAMLAACNGRYGTAGLQSLREVPDASVDRVWSQAVLEHVPRADFLETMREVRRVLKTDGVATHEVDLRDHLGGALNNLRFEDHVWERPAFARSGFYTNRIRYGEMLALFEEAGFRVEVTRREEWEMLPTPRERLAPRFRRLPPADLRVSTFFAVLRPA